MCKHPAPGAGIADRDGHRGLAAVRSGQTAPPWLDA